MINEFDFKAWILSHQQKDYQIIEENESAIKLVTEYGEATITFTPLEDTMIVEFNIVTKKDGSVKFYLHFELNDEDHAKQLYDEMVETLINLKDEKTLQVLLSCSAGLTTSMFAANLNSVAEMLGLDYHFEAVPYLNIYEEANNYDVVLLAPQISYMYKRLNESLPDKPVFQIPTSIFASYDALEAIKFIQGEMDKLSQEKASDEDECTCCVNIDKRILSIVLMINRKQALITYRLFDNCQVICSHEIIKQSMNTYDLYDIIDTVIAKHGHIDIIGIATPGIVSDTKILKEPHEGKIIDLKKDFEDRYHIDVFVCNNANAAVLGFSLEHPEYHNIVFHSQPAGFGVGGQGCIVNDKIVRGIGGVAGEVRFFLPRMQLSNEYHRLGTTQNGTMELLTKSLLPTLSIIGPEAVALSSPMTPDINEIKNEMINFFPSEFMPEFYFIKDPVSYMLSGVTKLCKMYLQDRK